MNFYFLDAGIGAEGLVWLAVIYLLAVTIVEWIILLFFNLGNPGKLILHSLIINVASAVVGYIIAEPLDSIVKSDPNGLITWSIFFVITILIEGFLLQLLNRQQPPKRVWLAAITMNAVTYIALFFLTGHASG